MATPMWFAQDTEGRLYMQTWAGSAKVKRILSNESVEVALSDAQGIPAGLPSRVAAGCTKPARKWPVRPFVCWPDVMACPVSSFICCSGS